MSDKLPFFAAESGTWKTTSPNPHIDLSGTALTLGTYPAQTFKAAADDTTLDFASTNTCTIVAWKDASNWKRYEGVVWTDAATDTLDLSAATLMGSAGTFSNDDAVSVVAALPNTSIYQQPNLIRGCGVEYSSSTAIVVKAGTIAINGVVYTADSDTTLTSGSTMVNLADGTVTLAAEAAAFWVFAYNNSGTLAFRVEKIDTTGDGQDVVWDATTQYYKSATTGLNARRIGKFITKADGTIPIFYSVRIGNTVQTALQAHADFVLIANGSSTATSPAASISPAPFVQSSDDQICIGLSIARSPAGTATVTGYVSWDSGTSYHVSVATGDSDSATINVLLRPIWLPYLGSLSYYVAGSGALFSSILLGFSLTV